MQTLWYFARDSWVGLDCHLVNNDMCIRFGFKHTVCTGLSSGTGLLYGPLHVLNPSTIRLKMIYKYISMTIISHNDELTLGSYVF